MMNPEYLTEYYILAYNKAMEMTKNPNIAIGAAMAVINVIAQQSKVQNQPAANPFMQALVKAMMDNKKPQKKEGENDENSDTE